MTGAAGLFADSRIASQVVPAPRPNASNRSSGTGQPDGFEGEFDFAFRFAMTFACSLGGRREPRLNLFPDTLPAAAMPDAGSKRLPAKRIESAAGCD